MVVAAKTERMQHMQIQNVYFLTLTKCSDNNHVILSAFEIDGKLYIAPYSGQFIENN